MALTQQEIDLRMEAFLEACRREGVKVTHQRMEIFREVARTEEHPDAETVYKRVRKRLPTVSLDTVYRALSFMEKLKLVSRVHVLSERARFDANVNPHHHFVCSKCGKIRDFQDPEIDRIQIPEEVRSWGRIDSIHLELEGTCRDCGSSDGPDG